MSTLIRDFRRPSLRGLWAAALAMIPRGGALSETEWRTRHNGICVLLWVHVVALPVIGMLGHQQAGHALAEASIVGAFAVGAHIRRLSATTRSAFATLGLLSSSAILVHFFDGLIEMHFHFFVMVAVVAVYQSWPPFLVALAFVLLHHGVIGAVAPGEVYNHAAARQHAWMWALVHGCFVLAESVACLTYWRVSENAVGREHAARARLEKAHGELVPCQATFARLMSSCSARSWALRLRQAM